MDYNDIITKTLEWCNARRAERGKQPLEDLPKGQRGLGQSCPCGAATGLHVGAQLYGADPEHLVFPIPHAVSLFVRAFDAGEIPQYDESIA